MTAKDVGANQMSNRWTASLSLVIGLSVTGCGGVKGPVPAEKLSTEKVTYEKKIPPARATTTEGKPLLELPPETDHVGLSELKLDNLETPVQLTVPAEMKQGRRVVYTGTIRWPRDWGKVTILRIEYFVHNRDLNVDVTQNETLAKVVEKEGVLHFQSEPIKAPLTSGKSTVRVWAHVIPADYDPKSGVPPTNRNVILGTSSIDIQ